MNYVQKIIFIVGVHQNFKMKKYFLLIVMGLFLVVLMTLPFVNAELGTFKQNVDVRLIQTCNNCTYCNFTIYYPNSSVILSDVATTKEKTNFYYDLSKNFTIPLGEYKYCYDCGNLAESDTGCINFDVTPSGDKNVLGFFILIIVLAYGVGFIGFFGKNEWVSVIGGLSMLSLGLYIALYGIDIYRNFMTITLSYFSIGLGAIFTMIPLIEMIQRNY